MKWKRICTVWNIHTKKTVASFVFREGRQEPAKIKRKFESKNKQTKLFVKRQPLTDCIIKHNISVSSLVLHSFYPPGAPPRDSRQALTPPLNLNTSGAWADHMKMYGWDHTNSYEFGINSTYHIIWGISQVHHPNSVGWVTWFSLLLLSALWGINQTLNPKARSISKSGMILCNTQL